MNELFVAVSHHYAQWSLDDDGVFDIADEDDLRNAVIGVFSSEQLYRESVESYFNDFEPNDDFGPISHIEVFRFEGVDQCTVGTLVATLNDTLDSRYEWTQPK